MKKILLILITFLTFNLFAQHQGGRGRGRQNQNTEQETTQKVKEFKASDVAGIFYYDEDEIIKKIKVKEKDTQYLVKKAIQNYNFKIKEISFLNSQKFTELNVVVNSMSKVKGDESNDKVRESVEEVIRPVRKEVRDYQKELNSKLEEILSEKQDKKWVKYQKNKIESLQPKKNQNNRKQSMSNRPARMR